MSRLYIFQGVATAAGPLLGGLLLSLTSFNTVFMITTSLLVASALPLFLTQDFHQPIHFSAKSLFSKDILKDSLLYMAYGIEVSVGYVIWPVFAYLHVTSNFSSLGSIITLMLITSLGTTYLVGRASQKMSTALGKIGAASNTIIWSIAPLINSITRFAGFSIVYGVTSTAYFLPHLTKTFQKADKSDVITYLTLREIFIQLGGTLIFAFFIYTYSFEWTFIHAAISSLVLILF